MLDGHVYLVCLVPAKQTVDKSRRVADRRQVLPLQVHACWDLQPSSALVSDANGDFANSPVSFLGSKVYRENESDFILCASITWNILLMCP